MRGRLVSGLHVRDQVDRLWLAPQTSIHFAALRINRRSADGEAMCITGLLAGCIIERSPSPWVLCALLAVSLLQRMRHNALIQQLMSVRVMPVRLCPLSLRSTVRISPI
jgi:hypothetical protein